MEHIAVTRSIVDSRALAEVIAREYEFDGPVTCKLISKTLRTQDNEHYLILAGGERYVVRIYQTGRHLGREESDYLFELDWLQYLKRQHLPVSYPIPQADGSLLGHVQAPEGPRYYAMFSFAEGKPMTAANEEQLYVLGSNMAQIHLTSNDYGGPYERRPMDLAFLVDNPVERLKRFWINNQDTKLDILLTSAEDARAHILMLLDNEEETADGWGPIGGDFHPFNTHFDSDDQLTFFNFDLCGYGWRAYDIAVFLLNAKLINQASNLSEAFFAGYYSVRPLSRNEHRAVAPFLTLRRVWLTGTFSTVEGVAGYTFIAPAQMEGH